MSTFSHRSFAGGEIAPSLHARVDTEKYQTGLATCRNFIVSKHGGLERRPGTQYVGRGAVNSNLIRLIPYVYSDSESYMIELGRYYMRPIKNGDYLYNTTRTITNIAANGVITFSTSIPSNVGPNNPIRITGVTGITDVNNVEFKVHTRVNSTTIKVKTYDSSTAWTPTGTYSSGGTFQCIVQRWMPYSSTELAKVRYAQNDRELFLCHGDKPPYRLWTPWGKNGKQWILKAFTPSVTDVVYPPAWPSGWTAPIKAQGNLTGNGFASTHKSHDYGTANNETSTEYRRYAVTTVTAHGVESEPRYSRYLAQTEADADAISGSAGAHNYGTDGRRLYKKSDNNAIAWTSPDGAAYKIAIGVTSGKKLVANDAFTIYGKDWHGKTISEKLSVAAEMGDKTSQDLRMVTENYFVKVFRVISSESVVQSGGDPDRYRVTVGLGDFDTENIRVWWTVTNRARNEDGVHDERNATYRVYRSNGGRFGFLGETSDLFFHDFGIEADYTELPPNSFNPFPINQTQRKANFRKSPWSVAYYQQRRVLGHTEDNPERIWVSKVSQYYNFDDRADLKDSDSFFWDIAGTRMNRIMHILSLGKLIIFTKSGEWVVHGGDAGQLSPTTVNMQQHSHHGSGDLAPLTIGSDALFYQPRGSVVRDIGWRFESSGYRGNDLTVFAGHLFKNYEIEAWDYQQGPDSVVWAVRSDGTLLGMTYLKEHSIQAWHRHTFQGEQVESVAVLPEGSGANRRDRTYLVIRRTVNGNVVRYIERLDRTDYSNYRDYAYLDASSEYNGWNTTSTSEMTISGGNYDEGDTATCTASGSGNAPFTTDSVGDAIWFGSYDDVDFKLTITGYTSDTVVTGTLSADVPAAYQATATDDWGYAIQSFPDLHHLEGKSLSIYADGAVLANPDNDDYTVRTVSGGAVTISPPSVNVKVGLPFWSDFETLDIDTQQGQSLADRNKHVARVSMHLRDSKGGLVGYEAPADATPKDNLQTLEYNNVQDYTDTNEPFTGMNRVIINPEWNSHGRVFVRQIDPLPLNVLAVHPHFDAARRR